MTMNTIADKFGVSKSTVHAAIRRVLDFLLSISEREIRWPDREEAARNKRAFRALDVVGAIDGCHVRITRPAECEEDYYNRKKFHSIILQGVTDADMIFMDVFVGFPGRVHDARVLRVSFLFEEAASKFKGGYLLGDAAYPLLPWLLPPYRHVTSTWQPWMSTFNRVHCKQRVVVEIAFGLLKGRFRRLEKIDVNSIPQAVEIVMATCVLHNLARRHADILDDMDTANGDIGVFSSEPVETDEPSAMAATLRDRVAQSIPLCLRQLAHRLGKEFLLCGDVNAHHPAWGGRRTDPRGREVRDILLQLGLVILNTGAVTYLRRGARATSTAIDLSVATEGCRYAWKPFTDTWGSDHLPILLTPFRGKAPRDREYRVVDWRVYRHLFRQDTGSRDLLQQVADNARAAAVIAKVQQGQPAPVIQHLALRAARRRAERQALSKAQPELWTVFRRVDALCRRHARRRRNQGCVSICVTIDRSRDGTRAWRLLKCLLMVPRAFNQVLSLAVHLTIEAADLADQLADQFAARDITQLPAAPPPAALSALPPATIPGG
ncbi:hypothetical protein HPB52_000491 [Rhipicephalus sanguineus]|uniref:Tick transposon n=1 Tax=Rhipicephalus sanguineus TaxID=34632 RepID=A0A9D4P9H9_RHISA|nr:hypothetical protein HPB52_000491 [Rhipicephalus sanguineus]